MALSCKRFWKDNLDHRRSGTEDIGYDSHINGLRTAKDISLVAPCKRGVEFSREQSLQVVWMRELASQ